jgi:hypothetical protein
VERPPADGELGAASTHGGVHLDLARLLAASSGSVRSTTSRSLACYWWPLKYLREREEEEERGDWEEERTGPGGVLGVVDPRKVVGFSLLPAASLSLSAFLLALRLSTFANSSPE